MADRMMQRFKEFLSNESVLFWSLILLILIERLIVLASFHFRFIDSDQLILWQAANDYSKGIFHEPYFYGQNYNFMLESLFAIPLLLAGIDFSVALPLSASFIAWFPFILFAFVLYRKGNIAMAIPFLLVSLFLPLGYEVLSSLPRGFATGLFFCGFLVFCILKPESRGTYILLGLIVSLGFIFNANSLVFSVPIATYIFLSNFKRPDFYLISITAALPALLLERLAKYFYVANPDFVVNWLWGLHFDWRDVVHNLSHLDEFFAWLTPLFWPWGWLSLLFITAIGIVLLRKEWKAGVSILLGILFIILTLGISKVNDGYPSVFLSKSRMFIGLPLFLSLSVLWLFKSYSLDLRRWILPLFLLSISIFILKISLLPAMVEQHTEKRSIGPMAIKPLTELKSGCEHLASLVAAHHVDLIIFIPNDSLKVADLEFFDYGCPLLEKDFTPTVLNIFERRTWVYAKEKEAIYSTVMIYGGYTNIDLAKGRFNCIMVSEEPRIALIRDNDLSSQELLCLFLSEFQRNNYPKY